MGQSDAVLDAWVYKSSGVTALDASALSAARASSFASAVSYCQKAEGYYLYRSDFLSPMSSMLGASLRKKNSSAIAATFTRIPSFR